MILFIQKIFVFVISYLRIYMLMMVGDNLIYYENSFILIIYFMSLIALFFVVKVIFFDLTTC
jgi:hypothetical protein